MQVLHSCADYSEIKLEGGYTHKLQHIPIKTNYKSKDTANPNASCALQSKSVNIFLLLLFYAVLVVLMHSLLGSVQVIMWCSCIGYICGVIVCS